jgi:hypothetical protein
MPWHDCNENQCCLFNVILGQVTLENHKNSLAEMHSEITFVKG